MSDDMTMRASDADCGDCWHSRWVEFGEGGLYMACTRDGGLTLIRGQSPEACPRFVPREAVE